MRIYTKGGGVPGSTKDKRQSAGPIEVQLSSSSGRMNGLGGLDRLE